MTLPPFERERISERAESAEGTPSEMTVAWYQSEVTRLTSALEEKHLAVGYLETSRDTTRENLELKERELSAAQQREERLVEVLESMTERRKGIPNSHVFRHDVVIHGGFEHRDDERGRTACKVCSTLAGSPPPGAPSHESGPPRE